VELAILETGLGGRLDSTTAANASIVGITSSAMDHEDYLGDTLAEIAAEKAATIRPGVTAVIGEQDREALRVLLERCEHVGVQPSLPGNTDFIKQIRLSLRGQHQVENASVSVRVARELGISDAAIIRGLETAEHAGRLELISSKPEFLLDGAHNPAGAEALRTYLNAFDHGPLTLIFGAMRDKKLDQIAALLFPLADCLILTSINNPRAASLETLTPLAQLFGPRAIISANSSADALRIAITETPENGLICVTGSLYLIGETRPLILKLTE